VLSLPNRSSRFAAAPSQTPSERRDPRGDAITRKGWGADMVAKQFVGYADALIEALEALGPHPQV
jgi:hypothetical protein